MSPRPGRLLWLALLAVPAAAQGGPALYGVAGGRGEVTIAPGGVSRFHSPGKSDIAFAVTTRPLPTCYEVSVRIQNVDTYRSGCRFGIFDEAVRFGGSNARVNDQARLVVTFQESKQKRPVYVTYCHRGGGYSSWDGARWHRDSWRPTGAAWLPGRPYSVTIAKGISCYTCSVTDGREVSIEPAPIPITQVRGCGRPDYFAAGDMVTDYVHGRLDLSSIHIKEVPVLPYLDSDMQHVVLRQAPRGRYAMYAGLTPFPDGSLYCVYKVGSRDPKTGSPWTVRDETVVWTRSPDGGRTWPGTENLIYANRDTRQEVCCGTGHRRADGTLMHPFYVLNPDYEERAKANNWCRLHLAESPDGGQTWSVRQIATPLDMGASFGGFVPLADGTLLLNVYGTAKQGTFRHEAGLLRSTDDGRAWGDYSVIGANADPDGGHVRLNETDVVELPSGRLLSMSRTQYPGFPLYRGVSEDQGRTWRVDDSGLTGLCPALEFSHAGPPEGTVVLVCHDRWGDHEDKGGVYLVFSTDEGRTWGEPTWISAGAYPCVIESGEGAMFCAYYKDSTQLRGTFFPVPFPAGLRVEATKAGALSVQWDRYAGSKAADYKYHVHRATESLVPLNADTPVGAVADAAQFVDESVQPGTVYYYRVTANDGATRVGVSWTVAARAGSGDEPKP